MFDNANRCCKWASYVRRETSKILRTTRLNVDRELDKERSLEMSSIGVMFSIIIALASAKLTDSMLSFVVLVFVVVACWVVCSTVGLSS